MGAPAKPMNVPLGPAVPAGMPAPAPQGPMLKPGAGQVHIPGPAQSGPVPPAPAQTAAMPPQPQQPGGPALPVAVPGPDYHPPIAGGVNPAGQAGKQPKKRNGLLIFGIVVCLLAAIALVAALIYVATRGQNEPLNVEAPSSATMQAAFDSANINPTGLSDYAYIDTTDFGRPELSDIRAGSVTYGSDRQSATCEATARAKWENDSVSVEQTVQLPFTYSTVSQDWQAGRASAQSDGGKVTPVGPPDIEKIQEALPDLLKEYDAEIAKQFANPDIAASGDLDKTGGEITFALDQAGANESDPHTQTDVNVGVVWEDGKGWKATINWVGEIQGGAQPAEGEGGGQNQGGGGQGGNGGSGDAQMLLTCSTGDLVEVPGVIEYRDNRVLLRSDYTIRVVLDGRSYVAKYFELTANTFVVTNGAHVSVVGEISATGTLQQAPLMINLDYEG